MVSSDRILFILSGYRPFNFFLLSTLGQADLNIEFLFITGIDNGSGKIPYELKKAIRYQSLGLKDKKIVRNQMGPGLGLRGLLTLIVKLSIFLFRGRYNIIITATENPVHSKVAYLWAKILRRKIIIWTESWFKQSERNLLMKVYHSFAKYILRNADAVLVHGTAQKNYCKSLNIPGKKIFNFNFCTDDLSKYIIKNNVRNELAIFKKKVILYMGRIVERKGVDDLITAFSKLEKEYNDVFLLICGDGYYLEYCKRLANYLKIKNIKFTGNIEPDRIADYYFVSDIFVLPSKNYKGQVEGWGLVLNEAASMGKAIITTDFVGGAFDLVKNGWNGYIVKNGDVEELYKAMDKIISDDKLREEMGRNSRRIFEEFNNFATALNNLRMAIEFVKDK